MNDYVIISMISGPLFIAIILQPLIKKRQTPPKLNYPEIAKKAGWQYRAEEKDAIVNWSGKVHLFSKGYKKCITHLMSEKTAEQTVTAFLYQFFEGAVDYNHFYMHFYMSNTEKRLYVVQIESDQKMPSFSLRKTDIIERFGAAVLGASNPKVELDPSHPLPKKYVVRGDNQAQVARFFAPEVVEWIAQQNNNLEELHTYQHTIFLVYKPPVSDEDCLQKVTLGVQLADQLRGLAQRNWF